VFLLLEVCAFTVRNLSPELTLSFARNNWTTSFNNLLMMAEPEVNVGDLNEAVAAALHRMNLRAATEVSSYSVRVVLSSTPIPSVISKSLISLKVKNCLM